MMRTKHILKRKESPSKLQSDETANAIIKMKKDGLFLVGSNEVKRYGKSYVKLTFSNETESNDEN